MPAVDIAPEPVPGVGIALAVGAALAAGSIAPVVRTAAEALLLLEVPEPAHCEQVEGVPQPQFSREAEAGYTAAGWWPWSPLTLPADAPALMAVLASQSTPEAWLLAERPAVQAVGKQAEPAAVGTQAGQAGLEVVGTPVVGRLVVPVQLAVGRMKPVPCVGEEAVVGTLAALAEVVGTLVGPVVEAVVADKPVALAVEGVAGKQAALVVDKPAAEERAVRSRGEPVLPPVGHKPPVVPLAAPPLAALRVALLAELLAEELVDWPERYGRVPTPPPSVSEAAATPQAVACVPRQQCRNWSYWAPPGTEATASECTATW